MIYLLHCTTLSTKKVIGVYHHFHHYQFNQNFGHDCMVVGFTTTYAISAYHH